MRYLRNILFLLCCWSVGTSLFAATVCLLANDDVCYVDASLPSIQSDRNHDLNNDLNIPSFSSSSPAILESRSLTLSSHCGFIQYTDSRHWMNKRFLGTTSGTSPPLIS